MNEKKQYYFFLVYFYFYQNKSTFSIINLRYQFEFDSIWNQYSYSPSFFFLIWWKEGVSKPFLFKCFMFLTKCHIYLFPFYCSYHFTSFDRVIQPIYIQRQYIIVLIMHQSYIGNILVSPWTNGNKQYSIEQNFVEQWTELPSEKLSCRFRQGGGWPQREKRVW